MRVKDLQKRCFEITRSAGFHEGAPSRLTEEHSDRISRNLLLIHAEISEACEEMRKPGFNPTVIYTNPSRPNKPEGFPIEIADAVLRLFELAEHCGIDLESAIEAKMAYDATRPQKHGKKF